MRLLFAGSPEAALPSLRRLHRDSRHQVVAVLTRPDAPAGRGRGLHPSPVAAYAREQGIETLTPARPSDPDFMARLTELDVDCAPVVGYGALLRPATIDVPRHGWVNLHFSVLPAWRGAAPVQHAVLHGDDVTGATTFLIGPGLDDGPVFGVVTEQIRPTDTSGDLLARLADSGAGLLVATMDGIEAGELQPRPQDADGVSLAPKLVPDDAHIDFGQPAVAVDRRIRACTPAPGPWATFRGDRLKLGPVTAAPGADGPAPAPGQLQVGRHTVMVGTATGPIVLGTVQPAGRKPIAALDWARGARILESDRLV